MAFTRKMTASLLIASALSLGGCVSDGYGSMNVGYGGGYYDDSAYGYGAPYGWYSDYYYPGSGYWIYDRGGNRHRWGDDHRRYWEGRREHAGNWSGPATRPWRREYRNEDRSRPSRRDPSVDSRWRGRSMEGQAQPQRQEVINRDRANVPRSLERVEGRGRRGNRSGR